MLDDCAIFERVRCHMLAQQAVSEDETGSCCLRGYQGRKCAIGCLIREEYYHPALEQLGISYFQNYPDSPLLQALAASGVNVRSRPLIDLLIELEDIHDGCAVSDWPSRLERLGREHGFVDDTAGCELATA
ncbi:hypothetical protein FVF58_15390 [Paraburkholderia panacisoli]|uniref:Uncharacterized protein n=1 Tax=Paraburkholderia panacisoli TaxID=2603818 RepID=A0A5B0H803_9BURK|nr:hypothetical protein FVF58_15390 [Paraburkholderia panacisoli]